MVLSIVADGEPLADTILVAKGGSPRVFDTRAGRLSRVGTTTGKVSTVAEGTNPIAQALPGTSPKSRFSESLKYVQNLR